MQSASPNSAQNAYRPGDRLGEKETEQEHGTWNIECYLMFMSCCLTHSYIRSLNLQFEQHQDQINTPPPATTHQALSYSALCGDPPEYSSQSVLLIYRVPVTHISDPGG
jgi:hypothetical protein